MGHLLPGTDGFWSDDDGDCWAHLYNILFTGYSYCKKKTKKQNSKNTTESLDQ